jgi:peptidoglycan/xylan/chitin deacetylase (PgdA/CDA1 family)
MPTDKKTNVSGYRKGIGLNRYTLVIALLLGFFITACTGHLRPSELNTDEPVKGRGFVIVTVKPGDTFSSLAETYLKDSRKGWWIASYNDIQSISAGQKLVIPLTPITYGGLRTDGYQTVPILLYYQMASKSKNGRTTTARQFSNQLLFLEQNGYHTIRLDELYGFLSLKDHIPPKSIVISFDTVGTWVYDIAYPLLKRHGMTAAIFITTEDIDKPGNLNWKQLAQMAADGFDIGTLGCSGKDLLTLLPDEDAKTYLKRLEKDIATAKSEIMKHTKSTCRYFAYPTGRSNDLLTAILKKYGFRAAFTRKRGSNPFFVDAFQLRRSLIYGRYEMSQFKQNITVFRPAELK